MIFCTSKVHFIFNGKMFTSFLMNKYINKLMAQRYQLYNKDTKQFWSQHYIHLWNWKKKVTTSLLKCIAKQSPMIFFNWKSLAPTTWKRGALKTLVDHAYLICSNFALSNKEIDHVKKVFLKKSDYHKWPFNHVLNEVEEKCKTSVNNISEGAKVSRLTGLKYHSLVSKYKGQGDDFNIKSMKKTLKTLLPDNIKTDATFQGEQLSSCYNISKIKQTFRINMICFTMLNGPKKVVTMTMSAKSQDVYLKEW